MRSAEREGAWNAGHLTSSSVCFPTAHPEQEDPCSCSWGARSGMQWQLPLSLLGTKRAGCLVEHRTSGDFRPHSYPRHLGLLFLGLTVATKA